jgi:hypothetical protein
MHHRTRSPVKFCTLVQPLYTIKFAFLNKRCEIVGSFKVDKNGYLEPDESDDASLNLREIVNWCQDHLTDETLYSRGGLANQLINAGVLPQSMATRFVGHFNHWISRAKLSHEGDGKLEDGDGVSVPAWYGWNLKDAMKEKPNESESL